MTPDEKLFDDVIADALDIFRLNASQRRAVIKRLQTMSKALVNLLLESDLDTINKARVLEFLEAADEIIKQAYGGVQTSLDFGGLAETVAVRTVGTLQVALGLEAINMPLGNYLASVASDVLIRGAPSAAWWAAQAEATAFKFAAQVRQGLAAAETNQQIIARIVGKPKLGIPGIMDIAYNDASALVHTSIQTVANDARRKTWTANPQVVKGIRQVSTLDSHTSDICIAYSGAEWTLDFKPLHGAPAYNNGTPRHFRCRSVEVPITKTFRELGLNIDEFAPTTRASDEGQIDAKTDFDAFLNRKGKAYQDEVLGEGRADLWRAGKITLRDLVSGEGRPLTLVELRAKYGVA